MYTYTYMHVFICIYIYSHTDVQFLDLHDYMMQRSSYPLPSSTAYPSNTPLTSKNWPS
jgi:hypothetical protein